MHAGAHRHARPVCYTHITCEQIGDAAGRLLSAHFTGWSYYLELHLSDNISKKLSVYCCEVQQRSVKSSAVIKNG